MKGKIILIFLFALILISLVSFAKGTEEANSSLLAEGKFQWLPLLISLGVFLGGIGEIIYELKCGVKSDVFVVGFIFLAALGYIMLWIVIVYWIGFCLISCHSCRDEKT